MLFKINGENLERVPSQWNPDELDLERFLVKTAEEDVQVMSEIVFKEPLLYVNRQSPTNAKKRADILALDHAGNGVIIELKKDVGRLGVETQALQYLADFSQYRGASFFKKFARPGSDLESAFYSLVGGDKVEIEQVNARSRVILIARSFDPTVFSMGEWLSSQGVAFRCISYFPVKVGGDQLLSFSVEFDRSSDALYPLKFSSALREPGIYWHNISRAEQSWWNFLKSRGQIPACFENSPGDRGEQILTGYVNGDIVVAYASGFGAIGWGVVKGPSTYRLISVGSPEDFLAGNCRHRLEVKWKAVAKNLEDGLAAKSVRSDFNTYHPIGTSAVIDPRDGKRLVADLSTRFGGL